MVRTLVVKKDSTPGSSVRMMLEGGDITVYDASNLDQSEVELIDKVVLYQQTSSRSLKFLYENFWHLVFNDPTEFKDFVRDNLRGETYAILDVLDYSYTVHNENGEEIIVIPKTSSSMPPITDLFGMLGSVQGFDRRRIIED